MDSLFWTLLRASWHYDWGQVTYIAIALENLASILFQKIGVAVVHLDVIAYVLTALGIICVLGLRWHTEGLSPANRNSDERNYKLGHTLVAMGNFIVPVAFAVPFLLAYIKDNPELTQLEWFAMPVIAIGVVLWLVGVQKVKRSRA